MPLPCQEQKENPRKERAALGNAALIPFASCARSMRGECGGIRFDRRLGAHRGFGRLGLLLIPFDRLWLLGECAGAHSTLARELPIVVAPRPAVANLYDRSVIFFCVIAAV